MKPRTTDVGRFHETPLVVFTSLAILGGGLAAGRIPLSILEVVGWTPERVQGLFVALSVGIGIAVSLLHLGRRGRMLQALQRGGRSALSTEVAFAGLTASAAFAFFVLPIADHYVNLAFLLWSITAFSGLGLLFAVAWVYMLPSQLFWSIAAAPSPLVLGLVFGVLGYVKPGAVTAIAIAALLAAEGLLYALRWRFLEHRCDSGAPTHVAFYKGRYVVLLTRLLLASVLPITAVLFEAYGAALGILVIGIAIDRFAFYALALRQTTEAEVARIESVIRSRQDPSAAKPQPKQKRTAETQRR